MESISCFFLLVAKALKDFAFVRLLPIDLNIHILTYESDYCNESEEAVSTQGRPYLEGHFGKGTL